MRTLDINKNTAPKLRAVHLEASGPGAIEMVTPDGEAHLICRRPSEPWEETLPRVAEALEVNGYMLAGNPQMRKRRPQLLLVVDLMQPEPIREEVLS